MRVFVLSVLALVALSTSEASQRQAGEYPWAWVCEDKRCLRKLKSDLNDTVSSSPLDICKLNCDDVGSLWPIPTGPFTVGKELVSLYPNGITFTNLGQIPSPVRTMMEESFNIFKGYINKLHLDPYPGTGEPARNKLQVAITVTDGTTEIGWSTDESYTLTLTASTTADGTVVTANISAVTFFGARHSLETLSQLIAYNGDLDALQVVRTASIVDKPVFRHRGMMLDTSRNYFNVESLKKLIDGLSYNKLNVFHWHITDSHSFPMEVTRRPKMTQYGAYSPEKIYTKADMREVVSYAKQRGVKVIAELDQPAHSGYGYQWGALDGLGDLVVCVESEPWYDFCVEPPCGQLNIVNDNVTEVIGDIFTDMLEVFDHDIFHMGGDEVDFRCYNSTKDITDYMAANGFELDDEGFYKLWAEFQEKALQKLIQAGGAGTDPQVIMWTSGLTNPSRIEQYLTNTRYVVQIWSDSSDPLIGGMLSKGYKAIFSNVDAMYLDCGFQAWLGNGHNWCSPIKGWQTVYDNNPEKIYASFTNESAADAAVRDGLILGGETVLWAEQADDSSLETRIWPRAAANAERLWSHPDTDYSVAEIRMVTNRQRMEVRGILGDRLQPEFCYHYEGKCYAPSTSNGASVDPGEGGGSSSTIVYVSTTVTILCLTLTRFL